MLPTMLLGGKSHSFSAFGRSLHQPLQGGSKLARLRWWHQEPCDVVDDNLGISPHIGGHGGNPTDAASNSAMGMPSSSTTSRKHRLRCTGRGHSRVRRTGHSCPARAWRNPFATLLQRAAAGDEDNYPFCVPSSGECSEKIRVVLTV